MILDVQQELETILKTLLEINKGAYIDNTNNNNTNTLPSV